VEDITMSLFDWDEKYSVGIQLIDKQHMKIVELINELVENIRDSREDYIINEVLKDLTEYSSYHFTLEEKLLQKYSYEDKHDHEIKHREFTEKINSLRIEQNVRAKEVPWQTLDYLENWFHIHELKTDLEFYQYLKSINVLNDIEKLIKDGAI
jgi:hemerythrin-like metal-binding protein